MPCLGRIINARSCKARRTCTKSNFMVDTVCRKKVKSAKRRQHHCLHQPELLGKTEKVLVAYRIAPIRIMSHQASLVALVGKVDHQRQATKRVIRDSIRTTVIAGSSVPTDNQYPVVDLKCILGVKTSTVADPAAV